jgi:pimeloyl-ACP methyl ester carboxylesterase
MTNSTNRIVPFTFGQHERRMFGVYHQAQASASRPAVVLCNAFGQEAIRAHRFNRTLAERLAKAGHAVLRFDYFGTGDSMGDDLDFSLGGASQDLLTAHDELHRRSNAQQIVWIGMRLGGTIALRAAHSAPAELSKLIVWDPIIDGGAYLEYLRERHLDSLENEYSLPLKPNPRELALDNSYLRDEAIGFALSPELRRELIALRGNAHAWPRRPAHIAVLTDPSTPEGNDLAQLIPSPTAQTQIFIVQHGTDWTSDTASNTALVPTAALMTITQQAGAAS